MIMLSNVIKVTGQIKICLWNDMQHWWSNRPVAQIPQCTSSISHYAPFFKRNVHMCVLVLQNGALWDISPMHCGICVMGLPTDDEAHPRGSSNKRGHQAIFCYKPLCWWRLLFLLLFFCVKYYKFCVIARRNVLVSLKYDEKFGIVNKPNTIDLEYWQKLLG